jgi:two-component system, LytTR family, response regulator
VKIRCIIVEDEPLALDLLEEYVSRIPFLSLEGKFYDAMSALMWLKSNRADLVFLDINLPDVTGIEFASLLQKGTRFIFTTAYPDFAVGSYEQNAFDYMLKPITFDRFLKSANKFFDQFTSGELPNTKPDDNRSEMVFVKDGKRIAQLNFEEILFFEAMKDYVVVHTKTDKLIAAKTMKDLEQSLPVNFYRIHNSYIVNVNLVASIEDSHVSLNHSRVKLPVSAKFREVFMKMIQKRML